MGGGSSVGGTEVTCVGGSVSTEEVPVGLSVGGVGEFVPGGSEIEGDGVFVGSRGEGETPGVVVADGKVSPVD